MVFCNMEKEGYEPQKECHNPYFNRWFSAIWDFKSHSSALQGVTILILIDGFLQLQSYILVFSSIYCHNPYFNRWFSAIP